MRTLAGRGAQTDDGPHYAEQPELALCAVLHLMSRFPASRSAAVANAVVDHLRLLCEDPRQPACVRESADQLVGEWCAYGTLTDKILLPAGALPS